MWVHKDMVSVPKHLLEGKALCMEACCEQNGYRQTRMAGVEVQENISYPITFPPRQKHITQN